MAIQPQPSAQGIASLYQGNPGALQQKIQQEQQAKPGMPQDLSKLMALNIVTNEADAAKRQEAMNQLQQLMGQQPPAGGAPGQPPTVAQTIQAQAKQKMDAMAQKAQQDQAQAQAQAQQAPPQAAPAQGIDQLPADFNMAGGGIVAFDGTNGSKVPEAEEDSGTNPISLGVEAIASLLGIPVAKAGLPAVKNAIAAARAAGTPMAQLATEIKGIPGVASTPVGAGVIGGGLALSTAAANQLKNRTPEELEQMMGYGADPSGTSLAAAIMNEAKPAKDAKKAAEAKPLTDKEAEQARARFAAVDPRLNTPRTVPTMGKAATPETSELEQRLKQLQGAGNVNVPGAPRPAGPGAPAAGGIPMAPQLAAMLKEDPEARKKAEMEEMAKLAPSSKYADMAMAEYDRRIKQMEGPKQGYGALMEYLQQIAMAPKGLGSLSAGAYGAHKVNELQKQRETDMFDMTMKKLDLGFKNEEAQRAFKLETLKTGREVYDKVKDNTFKALQEQGHNDRQASANATSMANAAMQASVSAQGHKLQAEMQLRQLINAEKRGDRDNVALQLKALSETAKDLGALLKVPGYAQTPEGKDTMQKYNSYVNAIGKMGGVEFTGPSLSSAPPTGGKAVGKV